jgi:hypothetical protein
MLMAEPRSLKSVLIRVPARVLVAWYPVSLDESTTKGVSSIISPGGAFFGWAGEATLCASDDAADPIRKASGAASLVRRLFVFIGFRIRGVSALSF